MSELFTTVFLDVYDSDTEKTLLNRLAEHSLVEFIYIEKVVSAENPAIEIAKSLTATTLPLIKEKSRVGFQMIDIYNVVLTVESDEADFVTFYNKYKRIIEHLNVFVPMFFIWCYKFLFEKGYDDPQVQAFAEIQFDEAIIALKQSIPEVNIDERVANFELYNKLEPQTIIKYNDSLKQRVREHTMLVNRMINAYNTQKTTTGVQTTSFEPEKKRVVSTTNLTNISLYEVFNSIELVSKTPFASFAGFYKILKTSKVQTEWINTSNEKIVIKFVSGDTMIDIYFFIQDRVLNISYEFETSGKLTVDAIRDFIPTVTPHLNYTIVKTTFLDVTGVFCIPNQTIETYILRHLVLINPSFSNFFIDESSKTSKTKTSIYMYFNYAGEIMSLVVTPKIRAKYDRGVPDSIKEGEEYVRVKISNAKTDQSIKALINSFSKIITMYNNSKADIKDKYSEFITIKSTSKKTEQLQNKDKIKRLSTKVDNELIPPGSEYRRHCNKFHPLVLSDEDAKNYKDVVTFPKQDDPSDFVKRKYVCDFPEAPYMGLMQLGDHLVPCCYKEPNNRLFNQYYNIEGPKTRQQHVIKLGKILKYQTVGSLDPFPEVKNITTISDEIVVSRRGVDSSRMSFLQCVLEAIAEDPSIKPGKRGYSKGPTLDNRLSGLEQRLAEIADDEELLAVAKQTLYDKSIEDIKAMLQPSVFVNPVFFKELFEFVYDCNIVVFNPYGIELCRTAKTTIPRRINPGRPTIMILMLDEEIRTFPQCELLFSHKRSEKEARYLFNNTDKCVEFILDTQDRMYKSFIGDQPIVRSTFSENNFSRQLINSFGKTAAYITKTGYFIYLDTPRPPSNLPFGDRYEIRDFQETITDIEKIMRLEYVKKVVINGVMETLEFKTTGGDVFFVPVTPTRDIPPLIESRNKITLNHGPNSVLSQFSYNQKVARYLQEFTYFTFSKYLYINNIREINDQILTNFVRDMVEPPDSSVRYKITTSRLFSHNENIFLTTDGKLKVQSREMLRRLIYCLRVEIAQRLQEIFEYRTKTHIENFIVDASDFDQHPQQILLEGEAAFLQYISEPSSVHAVKNGVLPDYNETYFFSNILIDDDIYIAKNAYTFQDAISLITNFSESGTIISTPPRTEEIFADLYTYVSEVEIIKTSNPDVNHKTKILVYNYEDNIQYTVLLKL